VFDFQFGEDAASNSRALAALGFNFIPVRHGEKKAAIKWLEFQHRRPTELEVRDWLKRYDSWAIITGAISGIVVVDCDSQAALDWARDHLPATPLEVLTSDKGEGFRGRHLYYRHPGTRVGNRARIQCGDSKLALDVRGDGGYVLAPGALHPSGVRYQAIGKFCPEVLAETPILPVHLLDAPVAPAQPERRLQPVPSSDDRFRRASAWMAKRDPSVAGMGGNDQAFRTACNLVRGFYLDDDDAMALLADWNMTCQPPWSDDELQTFINNARAYGKDPFGCLLNVPLDRIHEHECAAPAPADEWDPPTPLDDFIPPAFPVEFLPWPFSELVDSLAVATQVPTDLPGMMVLSALAENPDLIKVPNLLVGFKITDRDLAVQELAKLEGMLNMLLMFQPQLSGQFKRAKVGSDEFLTLTLTGEMIPWDVIPLDNLREQELEKGDVDKVVGKVKKLTQVIALGLHKDYLIFASGPSTELLARLGQAKPLSTRPEFKPLQKYADRRLVGIDYLSEAMAARLSTTARDIDDLAGTVKDLVSGVELSQQQKDQIGKDVEELAKDLKGMLPKPGAMMGFQFLVDQGMEGYTYQWAENPNMVANQPLSLLQHVGGGPILAAVGRSTSDVAQYELLAKWAQRAFGYFEQFALPQMSPDEREQYAKAMEAFKPLLKRWDEANRTLIRATADGQIALVVDAQLKSRQFCRQMPELPRPMPMIEPAVVLGVSDSERMRKAMGEYRAVFNEGVEALRKVVPEPDEIPPLAIPEPKVTKTAAGTLYSFPFPEQWGIAKEIVPTLGLSEKVGVAAATTNHAGRLLTPTPLSAGGVLADANRPRGMAVSFDWAGLVDAASPWVEYAVRQVVPDEPEGPPAAKAKRPRPKRAPGKKAEAKAPEAPKAEAKVVQAAKPNAPKPGKPAIMPQVRTVLNVLKCLRSITSETYREGDALVTHTLVEVRDLD